MKKLIQKWQEILQETVKREEAAGVSLAFYRGGKEICRLQEGFADRENQIPIRRDTIFRLYSMTKPVTAVAAMILIEQGRIRLDDSVEKYLSEFKEGKVWCKDHAEPVRRPILISDLLFMTSGLSYGDNDTVTENAVRELFQQTEERLFTEEPVTTREFAARAGRIPLLYQPGESWKYGISADILGAVIEEVAGVPFGEFLKEAIFEPLGMKDTGFWVPEEKQHRLAKAYERTSNGEIRPYTGNFLGIRNSMDRKALYESGGAGLVSTIEDYERFATMLLQGGVYENVRILKQESVERMLAGKLSSGQQAAFEEWFGQKGYDYGYLMRVMREPLLASVPGLPGEYCWDGWLGCSFWNYPKEKMTLIVMQQQLGGGDMVSRIKAALVKYQKEQKKEDI